MSCVSGLIYMPDSVSAHSLALNSTTPNYPGIVTISVMYEIVIDFLVWMCIKN